MDKDELKYPDVLQSRLANCLQTILDYEAELESFRLGEGLLQEFENLRNFMQQLKCMDLREGDVSRIERVTMALLNELQRPLEYSTGSEPRGLLQ